MGERGAPEHRDKMSTFQLAVVLCFVVGSNLSKGKLKELNDSVASSYLFTQCIIL